MGHVIVLDRQTLFDVALQSCGSVEAAFDIAAMNDISITYNVSGLSLSIPDKNKKITDYYAKNTIVPATEP